MGDKAQHSNLSRPQATRIIACGALANELLAIKDQHSLGHIDVMCLPAILHNAPDKIPEAVESAIKQAQAEGFGQIFVGYADCGTGGALDHICEKHNVDRLSGPHCYSFFSGNNAFAKTSTDEFTAFYLTDFLARQFDAFVTKPLGLDRHPELRDMYFGNYEKLVYLSQIEDVALTEKAREAAEFLGLAFEHRHTGFGDLEREVRKIEP